MHLFAFNLENFTPEFFTRTLAVGRWTLVCDKYEVWMMMIRMIILTMGLEGNTMGPLSTLSAL